MLYSILAVGWGALAWCPKRFAEPSPTLSVLHSVARNIPRGYLSGVHHGNPNRACFDDLQAGDILLLHNPEGAYGYWTHAALYIGDGKAIDAYDFPKGTILNPVSTYQDYDEVAVFRSNAASDVRSRVARCALRKLGVPYDPFSTLSDTHSEYCSKLIWQAFAAEGIQLCSPRAWVLPDDLSRSPLLDRIADWNNG